MATVVAQGKVKLANGQIVNAQQGGWYDAQQYWDGSLSNAGQINAKSNQVGAGQQVSNEVVAQTNPNNVSYIQKLQQQASASPSSTSKVTPSSGAISPSGTSVGAVSPTTVAPIDLNALYKTYQNEAGISAIEQSLADKATAYAEAQKKINDNPFLSESSRVGRVSKLSTDYNNAIKNEQDLLTLKNADIQTKLNLAKQQYDINSEASQQALSRFNSLLSSGALTNASAEDIGNLAVSTGLSTSAIQSAITATNKKNQNTQVLSYDDGTNQGYAVINTDTGEIISQQKLGASKSTKSSSSTSDTTKLSKTDQESSVKDTISSYINDEGYQAKISPEDLYLLLIKSFPDAFDYIKSNWTPAKIREKTS